MTHQILHELLYLAICGTIYTLPSVTIAHLIMRRITWRNR